MATVTDVENCYRYILGREMTADEKGGIDGNLITARNPSELRDSFLRSPEFHNAHLETLFENLVPNSVPVLYETSLGFKIYLDLRQLHISFGVMNESYDRTEVDLIRKIVPDDGVFIDVGANCGYYSLAVAAKKKFSGKVLAFEPLPPVWDLFRKSIAVNGWTKTIELRQIALGHAPGVLPLTDAEFSINAGATRLCVGNSHRPTHRTATVDTLDNVAGDPPDAIKVDIEGAEGLFLHGARETLQRSKPTLLFEINPELLDAVSNLTPAAVLDWLQKLRYQLWTIEAAGPIAVSLKQNVNELIGRRGMKNFLAIHADRVTAIRDDVGDASLPLCAED
jgi:FkbM family methyltransferase